MASHKSTSLEVRYAAGDAVLLGAGGRWLLIDVADPDDPFLEGVWELLAEPGRAADRILEAIDRHYDGAPSVVFVDVTPGDEDTLVRGSGRVINRDGGRSLRLDADPHRLTRRLESGMVAASGADLIISAPVPAAGLIDGVPPEILSAAAPDRPAEPARPVAKPDDLVDDTVRRSSDPDHDGHTTHRSAIDHLQQSTHETVLAVHCPAGHPTPALTANCRVCHAPVSPQEPHRMPRPRLGVLHLPDGTEVPLDRGAVFGRQPSAPPASEDWPQLVRLPTDNSFVSRNHLQVELDGWLVLATDLGSRGGTTLRAPGRQAERIRAGERYIWEPGQVFDLADSFEILYEVQ